jgi:hypothetical protein
MTPSPSSIVNATIGVSAPGIAISAKIGMDDG